MALEVMYGRDPYAGWSRAEMAAAAVASSTIGQSIVNNASFQNNNFSSAESQHSGSSWTTRTESFRRAAAAGAAAAATAPQYDANEQVPWSLDFSAKGTMSRERMTVHVRKLSLLHDDKVAEIPLLSKIGARGSMAVWRADPTSRAVSEASAIPAKHRASSFGSHHPELAEESPSVADLLMFPQDADEFHRDLRLLQYDYAFDVSDDTRLVRPQGL